MRLYIIIKTVMVHKGWFRKRTSPELIAVAISDAYGQTFHAYNADRRIDRSEYPLIGDAYREARAAGFFGINDPDFMVEFDICIKLLEFISQRALDSKVTIVHDGDPMQVGMLIVLLNTVGFRNKVEIEFEDINSRLSFVAGYMPEEEFSLSSDYTFIADSGGQPYSIADRIEMVKSHPRYPKSESGDRIHVELDKLAKTDRFLHELNMKAYNRYKDIIELSYDKLNEMMDNELNGKQG